MKRGAPDHPKVKRLARELGVCNAQAVGHLELLWHFTARYALAGDVGRSFSDADIEEAAGWNGEAGRLVRALLEVRWLDEHAEHRLCVHDWSEHADDAVNMALARAGRLFCDGKAPSTRRLPKEERERAEARLAEVVRTACAQKAHGTASSLPSPASPSLAPPELQEREIAANPAPRAPADDLNPEKLVRFLAGEPGEPKAKLAWLRRELPVIIGKATEAHPDDPKRRLAGIHLRVVTHFRQAHKRSTAPPLAIAPPEPRLAHQARESAERRADEQRGLADMHEEGIIAAPTREAYEAARADGSLVRAMRAERAAHQFARVTGDSVA